MGVELANGVEGKKKSCRGKVEVTEKKREKCDFEKWRSAFKKERGEQV